MKAGWVFVKAGPQWPGTGPRRAVIPLDINILAAGEAPYDHTHTLIGSFGLPSNNAPSGYENHWHELIERGAFRQMITHGAPDHDHEAERPWHLAFVWCSDAYASTLASSDDVYIAAQAEVTEQDSSYTIGELDDTQWTAGERSTWEARIGAVLGLDLPTVVDRPCRLVWWLLGALLARNTSNEQAFRMTSA